MGLIGSLLLGAVAGAATGLSGGEWQASWLLAATFTATGWIFTGVAAVAAQLGGDARSANSIAVGTLGTLFLVRGFLYSMNAPTWTLWLNPLAWMTETRPAFDNTWWPLAPAVGLTLVLLVVAFVIQSRRDFGVSAIPPRPGPARGRDRSAFRLALRINRGPILTWTLAFLALGSIFGYYTASVNDLLGSNTAVTQILAAGAVTPQELTIRFLVMLLSLVGVIAAVPGVQTMLKLRTEELDDRVEPLLATSLSRPRYFASNLAIALGAPAFYMLLAGTLIAAIASSANVGLDFGPTLLQATITGLPVWTVVAVSAAVIGARPAEPIAAWVGVLASFALTVLGPTFKLWDWILAISPFWHIPNATDPAADWTGLIWISLATLAFLLIGAVGFRRRDIA